MGNVSIFTIAGQHESYYKYDCAIFWTACFEMSEDRRGYYETTAEIAAERLETILDYAKNDWRSFKTFAPMYLILEELQTADSDAAVRLDYQEIAMMGYSSSGIFSDRIRGFTGMYRDIKNGKTVDLVQRFNNFDLHGSNPFHYQYTGELAFPSEYYDFDAKILSKTFQHFLLEHLTTHSDIGDYDLDQFHLIEKYFTPETDKADLFPMLPVLIENKVDYISSSEISSYSKARKKYLDRYSNLDENFLTEWLLAHDKIGSRRWWVDKIEDPDLLEKLSDHPSVGELAYKKHPVLKTIPYGIEQVLHPIRKKLGYKDKKYAISGYELYEDKERTGKLRSLRFKSIQAVEISSELFEDCQTVTEVNFEACQDIIIDTSAFAYLSSLDKLTFKECVNLTLRSSALAEITGMEVVNFNKCTFELIETSPFDGCGVQKLILMEVEITNLIDPENLFRGLEETEELQLYSLNSPLHKLVFTQLKSLKNLSLKDIPTPFPTFAQVATTLTRLSFNGSSFNSILSFLDGTKFQNLTSLSLYDLDLGLLPHINFEPFPVLENLSFRNCNLRAIVGPLGKILPNLTSLRLYQCKGVLDYSSELIESIRHISILQITHPENRFLSNDFFEPLSGIKEIFINENISIIPIADLIVNRENKYPNLSYLSLSAKGAGNTFGSVTGLRFISSSDSDEFRARYESETWLAFQLFRFFAMTLKTSLIIDIISHPFIQDAIPLIKRGITHTYFPDGRMHRKIDSIDQMVKLGLKANQELSDQERNKIEAFMRTFGWYRTFDMKQ